MVFPSSSKAVSSSSDKAHFVWAPLDKTSLEDVTLRGYTSSKNDFKLTGRWCKSFKTGWLSHFNLLGIGVLIEDWVVCLNWAKRWGEINVRAVSKVWAASKTRPEGGIVVYGCSSSAFLSPFWSSSLPSSLVTSFFCYLSSNRTSSTATTFRIFGI